MRLIHRIKKSTIFFIKLSVSLGLIVYLGWIVDWKQAVKTISDADKLLLLIVPFLLLASLGAAAFRWRLILADNKVALSFWDAYTDYLVVMFYNVLLPGVTGGDVVRTARCVRQTKCKLGTATASVLLERTIGLFTVLSIALFVYLLFPATLSSLLTTEETSVVKTAATIGIILVAVMVLGRRVWLRWLPHEDAEGILGFIRSAMQTLIILKGRTLGVVFILTLLFQSTHIVVAFLLSQAIGLAVPLTEFFAIIPLVYLVTFLPISLGGLGVREGMLVFLLAQFNVATTDAVTLSFLIYLNPVVVGSLGGILQLKEALSNRKVESAVKVDNTASLPNKN